jgi:hypothetical protein
MALSAEPPQHPKGLRLITRLAEKFPLHRDNGIRRNHKPVGKTRSNRRRFPAGIFEGEGTGIEMINLQFLNR